MDPKLKKLFGETRLTLTEAARRESVHPSTIWRAALEGRRGVTLETFVHLGRRFTTAEALERFHQRANDTLTKQTPKSDKRRRPGHARAEAELDRFDKAGPDAA
ncbi:MAG: DUF1580 domain-containing protein [Rhodopirellula sp.]|nr:DUF1580 domain-containing protein [Rhodopirellula sp.]